MNIVRAAVAGAIGGLAGAAVKILCEAIVPPRTPDRDPPPGVLADKIVRALGGAALSTHQKETTSAIVHWIFSTTTGALYGILRGDDSRERLVAGTAFGTIVWLGFHEVTLPFFGATPPLSRLPIAEQSNELVSHAIFGNVVESVRTIVLRASSAFDR